MSLALNSVRTMGHVSILRNAPALFIGVSRLHRTTLFQQSLRVFPTFTQKETSKAMIAAPKPVIPAVAPRAVSPVFVSKLIDPETRQRHRIKRMAAQQIYQQNAKRLSVTIYNAGPTLYLGHFGSNYYDYDSEDSEQSDSNQYEWILRACFHGFWSALFTVVYEIARGRPLGEGAWEDEEEWDDNDEIRELEEENDELRDEIGRLRRENSKLKGQSEEEFEDEEFDRLVNG
ncbi:hypothetical protein J3E72DRAFT_372737 [Bipolaris maydis]|uniref:uncharacterized protein n=1 Tax=Cochliobolus heterostrophus TaxID=5016 RepID=UPI0024CE26F5|nr:hypothetical protein J3E73DRAFT_367618 [Bipolaris maydis]KAJ5063478.1 hypothetical protein J3E74DRAFT_287767 [Bipolaris maydis]KAJ6199736.1 hypothetical protein J3E72DRAFT_372737 [Bipolaris maydis]KAJ6272862.1 hypothetical protein PSV08DRAFT_245657 [Bipolaris maydis]KAJ6279226.1 hypothetical protein J3E71DRAFT_345098 [Bipolaris maydis]